MTEKISAPADSVLKIFRSPNLSVKILWLESVWHQVGQALLATFDDGDQATFLGERVKVFRSS